MTNILERYIKPLNSDFINASLNHGLNFIIVGGAAVAFYGCRSADEVDDLDLMVNPTLDNEKKLTGLFKALGLDSAEVRIAGPKFRQITVKSTFYLDLLTPPTENICFTELLQRAEKTQVGHSAVKVIALVDLMDLLQIAIILEKRNIEAAINIEKIDKLSRDLSCLKRIRKSAEQNVF